jgi:hypothetical protein
MGENGHLELLRLVGEALYGERWQAPIAGDLVRAHLTEVRTGRLKAAGQGVHLPVEPSQVSRLH